MKSVLLSIVLLLGANAFASTPDLTILSCSTSGNAIALLTIYQDGYGQGQILIQRSEVQRGRPSSYKITSGFRDLLNGTSTTIVAEGKRAQTGGGETTDSLLLRVMDGQDRATMGWGNSVFRLRCWK